MNNKYYICINKCIEFKHHIKRAKNKVDVLCEQICSSYLAVATTLFLSDFQMILMMLFMLKQLMFLICLRVSIMVISIVFSQVVK